jgi:hypothetical protein
MNYQRRSAHHDRIPIPIFRNWEKFKNKVFDSRTHLTDDNMTQRLNISKLLQEKQLLSQFLCDLVTGDEKWGFYSNVTRKKQWLVRGQNAISTPKTVITF